MLLDGPTPRPHKGPPGSLPAQKSVLVLTTLDQLPRGRAAYYTDWAPASHLAGARPILKASQALERCPMPSRRETAPGRGDKRDALRPWVKRAI